MSKGLVTISHYYYHLAIWTDFFGTRISSFLVKWKMFRLQGWGEKNIEYALFSDMQCHCITLVIQYPRNHTPMLDCIVTTPAWYTWSTLSTHDLGPPYSSLLCPLTSVTVSSIGRESGSVGICPLCLFHHHSVTQGNLESAGPNMSTVKIFCFSPPFLPLLPLPTKFPLNSHCTVSPTW